LTTLRLADIVARLGGELAGDPALTIDRIGPLEGATGSTISFLSNPRYQPQLASSEAGCVIVAPALADAARARGSAIVTDDPYLYFARLTQWWKQRHTPVPAAIVDPLASVHATAIIGRDVTVEAFAVIGPDAEVGDGARIGPHSVLGQGSRVGAGSVLHARVSLGDGCTLGERCVLHPGVVVGADGFGFAPHQGEWIKIEQLGAVRIGNDVEIGANTCIDRGALDDTVIEDGVKLDNLIQIGHNVRVGAHTAMAGCVGVAGSADIGAHCTIGGGAVVLGHLRLVDGVHVSAASVVTRSLLKPGHYTGMFPIDDNAAWEKNAASLKQLNRLRERIKSLERAIEENARPPSATP
jgi:UDP-3-O-[3-hydroxymyristoyl] glucosamine N-acyltransferase